MKRTAITTAICLTAIITFAGCNPSQEASDNTPTPPPATPIPQEASISGTLQIDGAVVQNTTALMLERQVGETAYTAFDRLPAVNGSSWSFDQAITDIPYEITVALQVDEENKATGNVVTTTAPASDQTLVVNTDLNLPAPTNLPIAECKDPDSTGGYNPVLTYPNVEGAAGYYYQIGSEPGKDDIDKGYSAASNDPNQATTNSTYVKQDTTHYTRYAYTSCIDCNVYDTQNWSGWSPTLGFTCPE